MDITAKQIQDLWNNGGTIDRGDNHGPITLDDFEGLDIDTDDNGTPADDMWQVLADQVNSEPSGEAIAGSNAELTLQKLRLATRAANEAHQKAEDADAERDGLIRTALAQKAPVRAIQDASDRSRSRIYQIRDGRR